MTMSEKIRIHAEMERKNQRAETIHVIEESREEALEGALGYIYRADNMSLTFKAGDRLYIAKRSYTPDGSIVLVRLEEKVYYLCRMYKQKEGGYILQDEKNPPVMVEKPDFVGAVIGYERFLI